MSALDLDTLHAIATGRLKIAAPRDEDEALERERVWMKRMRDARVHQFAIERDAGRQSYSATVSGIIDYTRYRNSGTAKHNVATWMARIEFANGNRPSFKEIKALAPRNAEAGQITGIIVVSMMRAARSQYDRDHLDRMASSALRMPLKMAQSMSLDQIFEALTIYWRPSRRYLGPRAGRRRTPGA